MGEMEKEGELLIPSCYFHVVAERMSKGIERVEV